MLSSIANSTSQFLSNRRRGLIWVAGTIGASYMAVQWGTKKMGEYAERQRREGIDKDNLSKRFNLNLQDSQFTVLALLPTVAQQINAEYDVDECWKELKDVADRARLLAERDKEEEAERIRKAEQEEILRKEEEERHLQAEQERKAEQEKKVEEPVANAEEPILSGDQINLQGAAVVGDVLVMGGPPIQPSSSSVKEGELTEQNNSEALRHSNGSSASSDNTLVDGAAQVAAKVEKKASGPVGAAEEQITGRESEAQSERDASMIPQDKMTESSSGLSKSWAQVKVDENGRPSEVEQRTGVEENGRDLSKGLTTKSEELPHLRSRAELWSDIKLLSFTRTITSIYVLTLMTLQTHVQLSLLGRSAYVASVMSTLSGPSSFDKAEDDIDLDFNTDRDLELALYGEKAQAADQVGISKETERKYLTFSWWLLHRGWRLIGEKVKSAVEEVVGPMGLKSPIVYGELSTLMNQIRHRVEHSDDGAHFNFSAALFPQSTEDEVATLSSGGIPSISATINPELRRLLSETHDCLDSADGQLVRKRLLDALFTHLVLGLEAPFQSPASAAGQGSRFEDVTERTTILAKLLPVVAQHSQHVLNGMSNEYVEALEEVRELHEFSAIIYSSFDRENARATC